MVNSKIILIFGLMIFLNLQFISADSYGVKIGTPETSEEFGVVLETPSSFISSLVGNLTHFLNLSDTPVSYVGQAGLCAVVNVGETALEFGACGGAGTGGLDGSNVAFTNETSTWDGISNVTLSSGWFNGLFNWTIAVASQDWLSFDGATLTLNETRFSDDYYNKTSLEKENIGWVTYERTVTDSNVTMTAM